MLSTDDSTLCNVRISSSVTLLTRCMICFCTCQTSSRGHYEMGSVGVCVGGVWGVGVWMCVINIVNPAVDWPYIDRSWLILVTMTTVGMFTLHPGGSCIQVPCRYRKEIHIKKGTIFFFFLVCLFGLVFVLYVQSYVWLRCNRRTCLFRVNVRYPYLLCGVFPKFIFRACVQCKQIQLAVHEGNA